jgi:hypothetical protein
MRVKSKAAEMSASGALMKGRGQDGVACSPVSVSIVEDAGARSGRTRATSFPEIVQMMEHHVGRTASPGVLSAGPTNVVTTRFTTVYESVHLPSNFNAAFSRGGVWATR